MTASSRSALPPPTGVSPPVSPWRRTWSHLRGRPERSLPEAWELVVSGRAPALLPAVRSPAVHDSRQRLRAAYVAMPVLTTMHQAMPGVVVEGSSVAFSQHLDGDYWPDRQLIRLECHHPIDVIAFTLLHEFGHAMDHLALDEEDRVGLGHPGGRDGWRSKSLPWDGRGEEWLAESFAHWWWPGHLEAFRPAWRLDQPPVPAPAAKKLFDLTWIARRAAGRSR